MDTLQLIRLALEEDLGPGDLTTSATVPPHRTGTCQLIAKQELVVCGQLVARRVFEEVAIRLDQREELRYDVLVDDGDTVQPGSVISKISAPLRVILCGERVALNFLMRMSGIATHVRSFVDAAGPDGPRVVDTRKTTPLHRQLEKYAVRMGGAANHRNGLYDGVLIKDNHIAAVGSLAEAVRRARQRNHHLVRIQVETRTLAEVDEALGTAADALLLDNMDDETLAEAVRRCRERRPEVVLEASGNMNPERIARIKDIGLDVVSAGGLIHQARWADLSLKIL